MVLELKANGSNIYDVHLWKKPENVKLKKSIPEVGLMLNSARISADSSIGDLNGLKFFRLKREKEKALAATVKETKTPASLVAVKNNVVSVISVNISEHRMDSVRIDISGDENGHVSDS